MSTQSTNSPLRIGMFGTSRVSKYALLAAAKGLPNVKVTAMASRDRARAETFAKKHKIEKVFDSYQSLIDSNEIDVIYNPLPNSMHCEWTLKALKAGKHVLCEKPIASNAEEAAEMEKVARENNRVLMEAFHYRYHPLIDHIRELIAQGEIGKLETIDVKFNVILFGKNDFRYSYALGGGAMMDVGCYAIHLIRTLCGDELNVKSAQAKLISDQVDGSMHAELETETGVKASMQCSLIAKPLDYRIVINVKGSKGDIRVINPFAPHLFHRVRVRNEKGKKSYSLKRGPSTYAYQIKAFADAIFTKKELPTFAGDARLNMTTIDSIYEAAGMKRRGHK